MDGEAALLIDHRVARIRAAMAADNEVRVTREQVDDFALALVAPMPADDRSYRHRPTLPSRRLLIRVRGSAARQVVFRVMGAAPDWRRGRSAPDPEVLLAGEGGAVG